MPIIQLQHLFSVKKNKKKQRGAVFSPGQLRFDKQFTIGWRISTLIKTKTNCGGFRAVVSLRFLKDFLVKKNKKQKRVVKKDILPLPWVDLDLQTQSGY